MLDHVKSAKPVTVGFMPTRRDGVFDSGPAVAAKEKIEAKLRELGVDYVGLDWLNDEGLLFDPMDAEVVAKRFRDEGVAALFPAHCNFGEETAVGRVCRELRKPILLWGPRDEAPDPEGGRDRDTQCGLFATSKLLRRLGLPFTYIVNSRPDDEVFARGLDNFLRAANVVRCVKGARIGQIATRPTPFTSTMCNESELLERFGIEVVPMALPDIIALALARKDADDAAREAADISAKVDTSALDEEHLRRIAALKLVLRDWAVEQKLDGIAIHCWDALALPLEIVGCFLVGEMTDIGVPVACETDINGAITSVALQAAAMAETATFFADLTIRHPDNDNAELLWHCGPFPLSLAAPDANPKLGGHYMREERSVGLGHWKIKGGPITLGRFDGDNGEYSFLFGHAEGCEGPYTRGTYVWAEVKNWPLWEERLIYGPYIHHIVGVHGKYAAALHEAMKYLGIGADPVEPTEDEIRAYLRGQAELG